MKLLAVSGSGRRASTNTAMLKAVSDIASPKCSEITVFSDCCHILPVFTPDKEAHPLPQNVQNFVDLIRESDGLIVASPEYVRAIPGGLKNAIDWLVSRDEIIGKPIALMHASSYRGDDMLAQLRLVLSTVSDTVSPRDIYLRFDLMKLSPDEIPNHLMTAPNQCKILDFLNLFTSRFA